MPIATPRIWRCTPTTGSGCGQPWHNFPSSSAKRCSCPCFAAARRRRSASSSRSRSELQRRASAPASRRSARCSTTRESSVTRSDCADFRAVAAELALGTLTGRERGEALAHLETCTDCRRHLDDLTDAADMLLLLAPTYAPLSGFARRTLARLGP